MSEFLGLLAGFTALGIPLIVVAVLAILVAVALTVVQRKTEAASDEDDPDDDPAVQRVSGIRKLCLWAGLVLGIVGALLISAPEWATIF